MSERTRSLGFVVAMLVMAGVTISLVLGSPTTEDRVRRLGATIMCPVCQGESIADSGSAMAQDMMNLVGERVEAGATDEEIRAELLDAYSGAVLLDPPVGGSTLALWLAPVLALISGLIIIVWWRSHPTPEADTTERGTPPGRGRKTAGALILIGAFAAIVVIAGSFLQDRDGGGGVADVAVESLDDVSNDTMEAVIAANLDNPDIDGMRLALAERYFEAGDYRAAFPHYLSVAESAIADESQVVTALVGLGWMAWDGNGEAQAALGLFDQALAIDPDSVTARYLKGRVLWCGTGSKEPAAALLADVLTDDDLSIESRGQVEEDLRALSNGEACT